MNGKLGYIRVHAWVNLSETAIIFLHSLSVLPAFQHQNHVSKPQTTITYTINGAL